MPNFKSSQGLAMPLLIAGTVSFIPAVVGIVTALCSSEGGMLYAWAGFVTSVICAAIYFHLGTAIKKGTVSGDWNVLTSYILAMSGIIIVTGVADLFDNSPDNMPSTISLVAGIVTMVMGVVAYCVYRTVVNSKADVISRTLYRLLIVNFVGSVAISVLLLVKTLMDGDTGILASRCGNLFNKTIVAVVMVNIMMRDEVRSRMVTGGRD